MAKKKTAGLRPHADFIRLLGNPSYSRKFKMAMLREAPDSCIGKLCECILNILKGVVPLTPHQKAKIAPAKQVLRRLVEPGKSIKDRRKTLIRQTGGIFPLLPLLPALLGPVLGGLAGAAR